MKKTVSVVSVSFSSRHIEKIPEIVEREAEKGCDIIVLPETWTGNTPESLEEGSTARMAAIAKKYGVYIINAVYRRDETRARVNSSVLIDRQGAIQGVYDKMYPFWPEFDLAPPVAAGEDAPVFETDFGKIGMAICFDANFPDVWRRLRDNGAEFVFWSSAYSAGTSLMAHALNYNYSIISATSVCDCVVYDITGKEIFYDKADDEVLVSRVEINRNRAIFHRDFNMEKREKLLRERAQDVVEEVFMDRESWFVLKGLGDVSIHDLAKEYGMEELGPYKFRSQTGIDKIRAGYRS